LKEVVNRAGSIRKAAAWLGVSPTTVRFWLGRQHRYGRGKTPKLQTAISRDSAALILRTLHRMRLEEVFYDHHGKPGKKPEWLRVDDLEAERGRTRRRR
jgi:hypothetical protein